MTAAVGWVLVIAGGVWILQGLDVPWAPQSFMTGDPRWVFGGGLALVGGVVLVLSDQRRRESK